MSEPECVSFACGSELHHTHKVTDSHLNTAQYDLLATGAAGVLDVAFFTGSTQIFNPVILGFELVTFRSQVRFFNL